ncbi:MAG: hypothetical protein PVG39_26425 [Desulfobacteraceae bacterium]|jgi:hypothetical protein
MKKTITIAMIATAFLLMAACQQVDNAASDHWFLLAFSILNI